MAVTEPTSLDLVRDAGEQRPEQPNFADFDYHVQTYRNFLRIAGIFVAHVFVILALMALFLV